MNKFNNTYNIIMENIKATGPESDKYRWGCRCGHFGGLQKEDNF